MRIKALRIRSCKSFKGVKPLPGRRSSATAPCKPVTRFGLQAAAEAGALAQLGISWRSLYRWKYGAKAHPLGELVPIDHMRSRARATRRKNSGSPVSCQKTVGGTGLFPGHGPQHQTLS